MHPLVPGLSKTWEALHAAPAAPKAEKPFIVFKRFHILKSFLSCSQLGFQLISSSFGAAQPARALEKPPKPQPREVPASAGGPEEI